jgi:hypothetical protein
MIKPILPFCETMITYACNLSCVGCTNYSDYNTRGWVAWDQGQQWISDWLERVDIPDFGIIGGEPLMNPEVVDWIYGVRSLLPDSQIRFTTNGVLLERNPKALTALMEIGNCVIKLSVHQPHKFYTQQAIKTLLELTEWQPIKEHGMQRWIGPNQMRLQINFPQQFVKSFRGQFYNMLPHDSNPAEAFAECVQKTCPLLYNGRIYKCSSIALLDQVLGDWKRNKEVTWQPYLDYQGIGMDSSASDIQKFIKQFGQPETICTMCPTSANSESIVNHPLTTMSKLEWIKQNANRT